MFILSRRTDQEILVGDDIRIMVTRIDRDRGSVQIGIDAPKNIRIVRAEKLRSKDHVERKSEEKNSQQKILAVENHQGKTPA